MIEVLLEGRGEREGSGAGVGVEMVLCSLGRLGFMSCLPINFNKFKHLARLMDKSEDCYGCEIDVSAVGWVSRTRL